MGNGKTNKKLTKKKENCLFLVPSPTNNEPKMGFVKQKERQKSDCSEVFLPQKDKVKILQSTLSLA